MQRCYAMRGACSGAARILQQSAACRHIARPCRRDDWWVTGEGRNVVQQQRRPAAAALGVATAAAAPGGERSHEAFAALANICILRAQRQHVTVGAVLVGPWIHCGWCENETKNHFLRTLIA